MPELAEVEFFRRRWWEAAAGQTVRAAEVNPRSRVYRSLAGEFPGGAPVLAKILPKARLVDSATHGKQMWFIFKTAKTQFWLGIHLGMTGALRAESVKYQAQQHDAVIVRLAKITLVFNDPRQFGRIRAWQGPAGQRPPWLQKLPDEVLAAKFSVEFVHGVLRRHARAPLKAVLLHQQYFPGIGNWMADEILWRAALHPALPSGRAANLQTAKALHKTIQQVTRDALRVIAGKGGQMPDEHNDDIPQTWLFHHRWKNGGVCPKTKRPLRRAEIGGRTTCWSPARQKK
jgi:formamidopyrimidine-DNA glycosylase